jgi:purine-binding chemotaxis protein CheW
MPARVIDWDALHRRLAATAAALGGGLATSPEETRRILETRARALAKPPPKTDETERLELLTFGLAGESYGVETRVVREVCQLKDLAAVPCTPSFVAGVMNLRGQILAVLDGERLLSDAALKVDEDGPQDGRAQPKTATHRWLGDASHEGSGRAGTTSPGR